MPFREFVATVLRHNFTGGLDQLGLDVFSPVKGCAIGEFGGYNGIIRLHFGKKIKPHATAGNKAKRQRQQGNRKGQRQIAPL